MNRLKTMLRGLALRFPNAARQWHYVKYNLRDMWAMYLTRPLAPAPTPFGFKLGGLASNHHLAMQRGTFEPGEVQLLSKLLRDADVFVDVGANVGYFTCLARHTGKRAIAIEPMPQNLRALFINLQVNGWRDIEVIPMGVSDSAGVHTLFGASSTGASLIDNWAGAPSAFKRTVCVSTLDNLIGNRFEGERLLIKIDIEGNEYLALKGARSLLARTIKPIWLVEITLNEYHPGGHNPTYEDSFDLFFNQGYSAHLLHDQDLRPVSRDDVARWCAAGKSDSVFVNYLFTPRDVAKQ